MEHQPLAPESEAKHPLDGAPSFIKLIPDGEIMRVDAWAVEPTGNWDSDVALGEGYAVAAIKYARLHQSPAVISYILTCIQRRTTVFGGSGIDFGFSQRLAAIAYCGSLN